LCEPATTTEKLDKDSQVQEVDLSTRDSTQDRPAVIVKEANPNFGKEKENVKIREERCF
jgi:hypothetical protein